MQKQVFTSGEAARLCGLGLTTIKRWINRGALRAHRTPGGDLRIGRDDLVDFMRRYHIPMIRMETRTRRLLLALNDPTAASALTSVAQAAGVEILTARTEMDVGFLLARGPGYAALSGGEAGTDRLKVASMRQVLAPASIRVGLLYASEPIVGAGAAAEAAGAEVGADMSGGNWVQRFLSELLAETAGSPERISDRQAG